MIGRLRPLRRKDRGVGAGDADGEGGMGGSLSRVLGAITLGDGCICGDGVGVVGIWDANISASWRRAVSWGSLIGANGVLGCGFWSAAVRSRAASMAGSVEEVDGMS